MYVNPNIKTKKELKQALKDGTPISVFQPGPFGGFIRDGEHSVEGPHYPEPHRWYARVKVQSGMVTEVVS